MHTRSSVNWQNKPGSFDALHTSQRFPTKNAYHIPSVPHAPLSYTPSLARAVSHAHSLCRWNSGRRGAFLPGRLSLRERVESPAQSAALFERLLHIAHARLFFIPGLAASCAALERISLTLVRRVLGGRRVSGHPDDFVGRTRVLRVLLRRESHDGAWSAIYGGRACRRMEPLRSGLPRDGRTRIEPSRVLCYGAIRPELESLVEVVCYPTRWDGIVSARRQHGR